MSTNNLKHNCSSKSKIHCISEISFHYKEPWRVNPATNLQYELNTRKLADLTARQMKVLSRDVPDTTTDFFGTHFLTDTTFNSSKKLGNHLVKKLLPKTIKSTILKKRLETPIKKRYISPVTSPNNKTKCVFDGNYQLNRIFLKPRLFVPKKNYINNKLNINYAETETQYEERLLKYNNILKERGKRIKHENKSDYLQVKLNSLNEKICFMKGVVDYSYPSFVLRKIKEIDKLLKHELNVDNERNRHSSPFELRNKTRKRINDDRRIFLSQSINIKH